MSPRTLATTLPKITKAVLEKGGRDYAALVAEWAQIVGPALARASLPEKFSRRRPSDEASGTSGILTIRVTGGAAMEFQHSEPQILERINAYLGHRAVSRLKLVQGPIPGRARPRPPAVPPLSPAQAEAVDSAVATVADPELQSRLARLGRALANRPGRPRR